MNFGLFDNNINVVARMFNVVTLLVLFQYSNGKETYHTPFLTLNPIVYSLEDKYEFWPVRYEPLNVFATECILIMVLVFCYSTAMSQKYSTVINSNSGS